MSGEVQVATRMRQALAQRFACWLALGVGLALSLPLPVHAGGPLSGKIIVVDPGHGGADPGAMANGLEEKDLTLPIALATGALLTDQGAQVIYTRTSDVTVGPPDDVTAGLAARAALANHVHADVFLSIHANALSDPNYSGLTTFYGAAGGYVDDVARTPLVESQSRALARDVHQAVLQRTGEVDRGVQSADFFVLGNTGMPSILVETGFITNPAEARRLATPGYQETVADGIASGIATFFSTVGVTAKQATDANDARFVADLSYPDHSQVTPGETIMKRWKIANSGTTTWDSSDRLTLLPGGNLPGTASVAAPPLAPGMTSTLSVTATVPAAPGTYSATWRLAANGHLFGDPLWLVVTVPAPPFTTYWVETTHATTLWTDADPHADALARLGQWAYLQVTGPQAGNRLPVTEPTSKQRGYVDAAVVGPSGPPPDGYQPPTAVPPFHPFWVETTRPTPLRSGPADPSLTFGLLPQWAPLQVVAPQQGARLYVRNPATGGTAYVDALSVGPSGPPAATAPSAAASGGAPSTPGTPPAAAAAATAPPSSAGPTAAYTVQPGDTLSGIAAHLHTSVQGLAQANGLTDTNAIRAGRVLKVPPSLKEGQ